MSHHTEPEDPVMATLRQLEDTIRHYDALADRLLAERETRRGTHAVSVSVRRAAASDHSHARRTRRRKGDL